MKHSRTIIQTSAIALFVFIGLGQTSFAQVVNIGAGTHVVAGGNINLVIDQGGMRNDGNFHKGESTVYFDGSNTTTLSGSQTTQFHNLGFRGTGIKINEGTADVINTLMVEGSTTLDADGSANNRAFTMKSSDTATANVDILVNSHIIGNVTVERHIHTGTGPGQHPKSWQFLATPTNGQSIFQSWQENGLTPAGYGTWISGTGTGFDVTTLAPSVKYFNDNTGDWTGVTNTGQNLQLPLGYMLFVRGDRTVTTYNGTPNQTNMRSKGTLHTPVNAPPDVPVQANRFQSFGNPYASRVEFDKIFQISTGISNLFYAWDPSLNGSWGLGGYQTISALAGYIPSAGSPSTYYPAGVPSPYIESGQAVLVQSNGSAGNIKFSENCKAPGSRLVNRQTLTSYSQVPAYRQLMFCSLFTNQGNIADGNIIVFEDGLGNNINHYDAKKLPNAGENFSITRNDTLLSLEARQYVQEPDTVFFHLKNLRAQNYQFRFAPMHMPAHLAAFLVDSHLQQYHSVSLTDSSFIDVSINATPGSAAPGRFYLVFRPSAVVPVQFTGIAAQRTSKTVNTITWNTDNEIGLRLYQIEKSADGRQFEPIGTKAPAQNQGGQATYHLLDENALPGFNYYRVRAVNLDGSAQYSRIAVVYPLKGTPAISVYPNPVVDNNIQLRFTGAKTGNYTFRLNNESGQTIYRHRAQVQQPDQLLLLKPSQVLSAGTYWLQVIDVDGIQYTEKIMVQ